jgi:hypothetical protein
MPSPTSLDAAKKGQTAIVVPAQGLRDCHDLTYQLQFFSQPGTWPEMDWTSTLKLGDA